MSLRGARWAIWLLLFWTAPVPYMLGGIETAPLIRLLSFTALTVAALVAEGPGGYVWNTFIALGVLQLALYGIGLYFCAALAARATVRLQPSGRLVVVAIAVIAVVAITGSMQLYETPMSSRGLYSNLWQVLR